MPVISVFFGIVVRMWHYDHPPPHIHVQYQGFEALVDIRSGQVLAGKLPPRVAAMVRDWCRRHCEDLLRNWGRAQRFEPLERIPGGDVDDDQDP